MCNFFYHILLLVKNKLIGHNDFEDSYPEDSNNKFSIYGFKNDFKINYFIDDLTWLSWDFPTQSGYRLSDPNPNIGTRIQSTSKFYVIFVYYMLI